MNRQQLERYLPLAKIAERAATLEACVEGAAARLFQVMNDLDSITDAASIPDELRDELTVAREAISFIFFALKGAIEQSAASPEVLKILTALESKRAQA